MQTLIWAIILVLLLPIFFKWGRDKGQPNSPERAISIQPGAERVARNPRTGNIK